MNISTEKRGICEHQDRTNSGEEMYNHVGDDISHFEIIVRYLFLGLLNWSPPEYLTKFDTITFAMIRMKYSVILWWFWSPVFECLAPLFSWQIKTNKVDPEAVWNIPHQIYNNGITKHRAGKSLRWEEFNILIQVEGVRPCSQYLFTVPTQNVE